MTHIQVNLVGRYKTIHSIELKDRFVEIFQNKIDSVVGFNERMNVGLRYHVLY